MILINPNPRWPTSITELVTPMIVIQSNGCLGVITVLYRLELTTSMILLSTLVDSSLLLCGVGLVELGDYVNLDQYPMI